MWSELCPWRVVGLIFDIILLIVAIYSVSRLTKWALMKGWVGEKYIIVLLIAIVFGWYVLMHYDVKKLKCDCEPRPVSTESFERR